MTTSIGNVASVAARAGGTVVRQVRSVIDPSAARPAGAGQPASGWLAVTVFREPSDLAAWLRNQPSGGTLGRLTGRDPQADLRSALRRVEQLIEVGEVLAGPGPARQADGDP